MGTSFDEQGGQVVNIRPRITALFKGFVDAEEPVSGAELVEAVLHALRVHYVQVLFSLLKALKGHFRSRPSLRNVNVPRESAVSHELAVKYLVSRAIPLDHAGGSPR